LARFSFIPKDMEFYDLFEQETANLVIAAEKLVDFFDNYEDVEMKAKELKELEQISSRLRAGQPIFIILLNPRSGPKS